jgi:hypothetical protein
MEKKLFIKRLTALLLAALLCLPLISCGGEKTSAGGESDAGVTDAVTEEETDPFSDDLPEGLDFDGTEIRFLSSTEKTCIAIGENDDLGDIVNAALWQRNLDLENRLNVKIVLVRTTGFGDFNKAATESIAAGSDDYEVLCGHTRFNISLAAEKMLLNLNDVEYLDFTKPYWSELYTSNVNYKDNYYWAAGDITTSFIRYIYAVFVNSRTWQNYHSGVDLYAEVEAGRWTLDTLSEYASGAYADLNGNGEADDEDAWGIVMQKGHVLNGMAFSTGTKYTTKDENGDYVIALNNEHTVNVFMKLHSLFYETDYAKMLPNEEFDEKSKNMFVEGRLLFEPHTFGFADNTAVRGMEDDFFIIPMPKYDESQEKYRVNQYDGVPLFGIPVTVPDERANIVGAALEAMCSMSSDTVIPVYYDLALKNKYSRDETTARMIDLIHESITADFAFAWGDTVGGIMNIFYDNIQNKDISSTLSRQEKRWTKNLDKLMEKLSDE